MPELSIIIPIYNAATYLHRCIDSILSQSFTDYELLLIDDGSTDNSFTICDEYAAKDSRVRVFHKENGGVSSARNLGIENARGEWIYFVDADDEVIEDGLMSLYEGTKYEADIVLGGFEDIDEDGKLIKPINYANKPRNISKEECLRSIYWNTNIEQPDSGYLWIWLYKRSFIQEEKLHFRTDIAFQEDNLFNTQYICRCVNVGYYIDKEVYLYRASSTSITLAKNKYYDKKYLSAFDAYEQMLKEICSLGAKDKDLIELAKVSFINRFFTIRKEMYQDHNFNIELIINLKKRVIKLVGHYYYYHKSVSRILNKFHKHLKLLNTK